MLSAIREIGKLTINQAYHTEKPFDGKVLVILLDTYNNEQRYSGTEIEDFDFGKINQYLFKEGASKGNVSSPFCPLTEPQKTYKKIQGWLKQCKDIKDDAFKSYAQLIDGTFEALVDSKTTIIADITNKIKDIQKKTPIFLTIKLDRKYVGEYDVFRRCLALFDEAKRKKSANTGVCSICCISDKEVSGKTDVFKFYTIDKPGFITGGFKEGDAWKNYPVCEDCKIFLENGRKFIDTKLNFKFYGLNYYLIPNLLIGNMDILQEILNVLSDTTKAVNLKDRIRKRITNDENEILEYLSEEKDILALNFLFIQNQQSAERILLLVEDVFPSRIRNIFNSKDYVDSIFNNYSDNGFSFSTIRTFFSKSSEGKKESDLNKYFLEIVDSVLKGRRLDFSFLLKFYMMVIRKEFINDEYFNPRVKDALMDTMFFENLGLITFEEVKNMEESIFEDVFRKYGNTFASPVKRGLFLTGALTQMLLNKQARERGSKPFMKKLKGLKMNEQDIKSLLPAIQNKFEEYNSFGKGKKLVAEEAYNYLFSSGDKWNLSVDEINFYFAGGMNLVRKIKDIIYAKGEKDIDMEEDVKSNKTNE